MERLAKLKAKLFSKSKHRDSKATPKVGVHHNSQTMSTAQDCSHQGHFYWTDARRIYSDPAPSLERGRGKQALGSEGRGEEDWTVSSSNLEEEDDVFYDDNSDDDTVIEAQDCEFAVFGVSKVWRKVPEDVYTAWEDWAIPSKELRITNTIKTDCPQREMVFRGYWHGRVCVRSRQATDAADVFGFLEEVYTLSCIRHQNIQLFMGACLLPLSSHPLVLVMSELKGESLHTRLHCYNQSFTQHSKLKILHQIAEGMDYLHSKGIPHGLLTTSHVTLSCRVCISLTPLQRELTYLPTELSCLPPEAIRQLYCRASAAGPRACGLFLRRQSSYDPFSADVFAFGTVAYEVAMSELPFKHLPFYTLILSVGRGSCQSLHMLSSKQLKSLVSSCWSVCPAQRTTFRQVVTNLEQNTLDFVSDRPLLKSSSLPSLVT